MGFVSALKSILIKAIVVIAATLLFLLLFDSYIAPAFGLKESVRADFHLIVAILVTVGLVYVLKSLSRALSSYVGPHMAGLLTMIMEATVVTAGVLSILAIMRVSATTLLVSGGLAAIVIGLAVSTLAGNLISSALIYAAFPIKVGDSIFVGNVPGRVMSITAMYTLIKTEGGTELIIPNSAIVQGYFLISRAAPGEKSVMKHHKGDMVFVPALNVGGPISEVNEVYTSVDTDKGALILPSYSLMTGGAFVVNSGRGKMRFDLKVLKNVDKVKKALEEAGAEVLLSSLDGETAVLNVEVDADQEHFKEVKSKLLELAYKAQGSA